MDLTPELTWGSVAGFVRQHTHDVRNHLNSLDLEAALLADIVTDQEARDSVARLRKQIREAATAMRALSAKFADAPPGDVVLSAADLFEIWKEQHAAGGFPAVEWEERLGAEKISIDPDAIAAIFRELLQNAAQFGSVPPFKATAAAQDGKIIFTLEEPKTSPVDPSHWGRAPFRSTRRGGYGLGLWEIERRVRANGGTIQREFDQAKSTLITTLTFPISAE